MDTVLFLCTGNYYRSRFAEEYFNHRAIHLGLKWRADSRGLRQNMQTLRNVGPIASAAVDMLHQLHITPIMASRFPLSVSIRDFQNATKIIAMSEREHRPMVRDYFPMYENMIDYWDIDDQPLLAPDKAFRMMQNRVDKFIEQNIFAYEF